MKRAIHLITLLVTATVFGGGISNPGSSSGNVTTYTYEPTGWNNGWRSALAASASSPARILFIGDSLPFGYNATAEANTIPSKIMTGLVPTYGRYAEYWTTSARHSALNAPTDSPMSDALNANTFSTFQEGWHTCSYYGGSANAVQTFTPPFNCTKIDLLYMDDFPGSFDWQVDGGSRTTVTNTSGAHSQANAQTKRVTSGTLTSAAHTFTWGWQSGNAACMSLGAVAYTGSAGGIAMTRFCVSGQKVGDYDAGQTLYPADRVTLLTNKSPQNDATASGSGTFGYPLGSDLVIFELIVNDVAGTAENTFYQTIYRFVSALRRDNPNCSVLFVIPAYPYSATADTSTGFTNQTSYNQYTRSIYQIADLYGCAVLNIHKKWGQTPFAQGFMLNNNLHPTDAGYNDIATEILALTRR